MINKIFNADDFGISPGVNMAIQKAYNEGVLNAASLMVNCKWAGQAVVMAKDMPELELGLHANLTNQKAILSYKEIPLLVDREGNFKHGFVGLLGVSLLHPMELQRQAKAEIKAQLKRMAACGLKIKHLDAHRHVQMIPVIFKACMDLAKEEEIERIRFINENPLSTIRQTKGYEWLKDGGLIKSMVLSGCAVVNKLLWRYKTDTYFYSIINTCKISKEKLQGLKVPRGFSQIEIMLHPGMPEMDKEFLSDVFDDNILNDWRRRELETLLDKEVA